MGDSHQTRDCHQYQQCFDTLHRSFVVFDEALVSFAGFDIFIFPQTTEDAHYGEQRRPEESLETLKDFGVSTWCVGKSPVVYGEDGKWCPKN